jgi:hypothetical protein
VTRTERFSFGNVGDYDASQLECAPRGCCRLVIANRTMRELGDYSRCGLTGDHAAGGIQKARFGPEQ